MSLMSHASFKFDLSFLKLPLLPSQWRLCNSRYLEIMRQVASYVVTKSTNTIYTCIDDGSWNELPIWQFNMSHFLPIAASFGHEISYNTHMSEVQWQLRIYWRREKWYNIGADSSQKNLKVIIAVGSLMASCFWLGYVNKNKPFISFDGKYGMIFSARKHCRTTIYSQQKLNVSVCWDQTCIYLLPSSQIAISPIASSSNSQETYIEQNDDVN